MKKTMSERYTTESLVCWINGEIMGCEQAIGMYPGGQKPAEDTLNTEVAIYRAIKNKLKAADALCAAAKDAKHELTFAPCRDNPERTSCLKCGTTEALRKATADYEEA